MKLKEVIRSLPLSVHLYILSYKRRGSDLIERFDVLIDDKDGLLEACRGFEDLELKNAKICGDDGRPRVDLEFADREPKIWSSPTRGIEFTFYTKREQIPDFILAFIAMKEL
ncbi:MAG: hypothetical protein ACTSPB_24800 [Candidatus Thorarchaeota archaeon]